MNRPPPSPDPAPSAAWSDRFWAHFHARRPVDSTFIGRTEHVHRLSEVDEASLGDTLSEMRALIAGVPADAGALETIDLDLARGFLEIQVAEHESGHLLDNPSTHVGEAVFGLMSLLLSGVLPEARRHEALRERLAGVPAFLDGAAHRVRPCHRGWTKRAERECRGALAFLREGLEHVDITLGVERDAAIRAFERFGNGLADLAADVGEGAGSGRGPRSGASPASRRARPVACGPELFDLYLRRGHFLDRSADDVLGHAREELAVARARLADHVGALGAADVPSALARIGDARPPARGYYDRYRETWEAMRAVSEEQGLVTWLDHPIRYVPRPAWARAAAPDLYFLFYRSPAAYGTPPVHDYLVSPLDPALDGEELDAFLRANNDAVIKLNHVIHHGGLGHHVQNAHARRAPLAVGRVAAVDGAYRIAMFCGGTMAEGWACYATDLMAEVGALGPLERLSEAHGRVRMCARAVVDVELHHGRMTLEEAATFYAEVAGMPPASAEAEAVKNSMFPGAALMYLVGTDAIHDLRADVVQRGRGAVSLGDFHDAVLSYGSIPVALVAREVRRRLEGGLPLRAHHRAGADERMDAHHRTEEPR